MDKAYTTAPYPPLIIIERPQFTGMTGITGIRDVVAINQQREVGPVGMTGDCQCARGYTGYCPGALPPK